MTTYTLLNVHEIKWFPPPCRPNVYLLMIDYQIDDKPPIINVGYVLDFASSVGLAPTLQAWMNANPDFPIGEVVYEPEPEPEPEE